MVLVVEGSCWMPKLQASPMTLVGFYRDVIPGHDSQKKIHRPVSGYGRRLTSYEYDGSIFL